MLSGTMVVLRQTKLEGPIVARRAPESLYSLRTQSKTGGFTKSDIAVGTIPHGSRVLYISSKQDDFNTALRNKGRGPFGYTPVGITYHFILWEGRPVWISSADATMTTEEKVTQ